MAKSCREVLPEFFGRHLRLGFVDGTGFIWCNLCGKDTEAEIRHEQNVIREQLTTSLNNSKMKLETLKSNGYGSYKYKIEKNHPHIKRDLIPKRWRSLLESMGKTIKRTQIKLDLVTEDKDFILNAKVVRTFLSEDPEEYPGTTIILLDGDFDGKYWNESEYLGIPYRRLDTTKFNEEGWHKLCAQIVKGAAAAQDKEFFYGPEFKMFLPDYDGPAVWRQIHQNYKSSDGKKWYQGPDDNNM